LRNLYIAFYNIKMQNIYEKLKIPEHDRLTSIRKVEAEFIFDFLHNKKISQTLETGFAYGCSTAYIISATKSPHVAIDPYQDRYRNLGLKNINQLGLESYLRFVKTTSHIALPNLLQEGLKIDFGFIDGGHKFDEIFIDWFYIDLLLNDDGYVMFDDAWLSSTKAVASFIRNNREDYTEISTPINNIFLFQKVGKDNREWSHFKDFDAKYIGK
jgi:predicted O-methyltransferase YrrM